MGRGSSSSRSRSRSRKKKKEKRSRSRKKRSRSRRSKEKKRSKSRKRSRSRRKSPKRKERKGGGWDAAPDPSTGLAGILAGVPGMIPGIPGMTGGTAQDLSAILAGAPMPGAAPGPEGGRLPEHCADFRMGRCSRGTGCRFLHPGVPTAGSFSLDPSLPGGIDLGGQAASIGGAPECGDFRMGRCTRGDRCRYMHPGHAPPLQASLPRGDAPGAVTMPGGEPTMTVEVEQRFVGWLIGPGGASIREIRDQSGANTNIDQATKDQGFSIVKIYGSFEQAEHAAQLIKDKIAQRSGGPPRPGGGLPPLAQGKPLAIGDTERPKDDAYKVDQWIVVNLIGQGGETLRKIQDESGVKVLIDQQTKEEGYSVLRIGNSGAMQNRLALEMVREKIDQCAKLPANEGRPIIHWTGVGSQVPGQMLAPIMANTTAPPKMVIPVIAQARPVIAQARPVIPPTPSLSVPPPSVEAAPLKVDQKFVGFIMGKNGETLQRIREKSGASVSVDETTKRRGYSSFRISGSTSASEMAHMIIQGLIDELTGVPWGSEFTPTDHADGPHELRVEAQVVSYVVGRAGELLDRVREVSGAHIVADEDDRYPGTTFIRILPGPGSDMARAQIMAKIAESKNFTRNNEQIDNSGVGRFASNSVQIGVSASGPSRPVSYPGTRGNELVQTMGARPNENGLSQQSVPSGGGFPGGFQNQMSSAAGPVGAMGNEFVRQSSGAAPGGAWGNGPSQQINSPGYTGSWGNEPGWGNHPAQHNTTFPNASAGSSGLANEQISSPGGTSGFDLESLWNTDNEHAQTSTIAPIGGHNAPMAQGQYSWSVGHNVSNVPAPSLVGGGAAGMPGPPCM